MLPLTFGTHRAQPVGFLVLMLLAAVFTQTAEAQQGYEFGLRFNPVNFRPVNFGGFSFQQASFRGINTQPIQFQQINFPALNSRTVRRNAGLGNDSGVATQRARQRVVSVRGEPTIILRSRSDGRSGERLVLRKPYGETYGANEPIAPHSPELTSPTRLARIYQASYPLQRTRISQYYPSPQSAAALGSVQVNSRREIVAARLAARNPARIARQPLTNGREIGSSALLAGRSLDRLRIVIQRGRQLR